MSFIERDLIGAQVLVPGEGLQQVPLSLSQGQVTDSPVGRPVDLSGCLVLPGMIDLHGDGFERHVAPRRGAMKQMNEGILAAEAELAVNGLTTAVMAQFFSWEGGLRGPEFASDVFDAIRAAQGKVVTDLRAQLRFEIHLLEHYDALPGLIAGWGVDYVVFNDHLPHDSLAKGKRPPRLTGQALKAGRNPERHLEFLQELHARKDRVPAALDDLCRVLGEQGLRLGSHDDQTAEDRQTWHQRGAWISEFPETLEAAEAAHAAGDLVVMGAPNLVRGGSHKGNASAIDLIVMGLCDALASDYHYPSLRRAALMLVRTGVLEFEAAWNLVSAGPAKAFGWNDRGQLLPGKRADLVVLDAETHQVGATISGGRVSYMNGEIAARFLA